MDNLVMGLDISTSNVGISIFGVDGKLMELNHLSPIVKGDYEKHDELFLKSKNVSDYIFEQYGKYNIGEIIIETPLISSQQIDTAALLNYFNGMVFANLKQKFTNTVFHYITVDEARRYGLPEILSKKKTLFGDFKEEKNIKNNDIKKIIVLLSVAQKYPNVIWLLNNNLTLDKKNFDRADAVVVVLGYKLKNGEWKDKIPPSNPLLTKEFIKEYISYENNFKTIKKIDESIKYNHLKNVMQIEKFLNVAI